MKYWLVAALICFGSGAWADIAPAPDLNVSGIPGLLSDKLKEIRGAAILTFGAKPGAGGYLPIWTWHTKDGVPLVEFPTIGYRGQVGQRPDAFSHISFNLPGLSNQFFGSQWFVDHVTKSKFPPIFFGPALIAPLDYRVIRDAQIKDWQKYMAVVVSVGLK